MAYVKIKPIHQTLEKALLYITNQDKTAEGILVTSHACSTLPLVAKLEFDLVSKNSLRKRKDAVIARHLIQSFAPEDHLTSWQANDIGKQLAQEILGNDFQYLVATHIDRGHLHNHIIFNATSITDNKKYRSNKFTYDKIQKASDRLCKEYGISVIPPKLESKKGKSYKEYLETQKGSSWKENLKNDIDDIIRKATTYENFLEEMRERKVEVKQGKYLAFRPENQSRFTRGKTLGEKYSEESIRYRIEKSNAVSVGKMIEKNENNKEKGIGFQKFSAKKNIHEMAQITKFMSHYKIDSFADIEKIHQETTTSLHEEEFMMLMLQEQINRNEQTIEILNQWRQTKAIFEEYSLKSGSDKKQFMEEHSAEIHLHKESKNELKNQFSGSKIPKMSTLRNEIFSWEAELKDHQIRHYALKKDLQELTILKENIRLIQQTKNKDLQKDNQKSEQKPQKKKNDLSL